MEISKEDLVERKRVSLVGIKEFKVKFEEILSRNNYVDIDLADHKN